jgi:hypothetical protein
MITEELYGGVWPERLNGNEVFSERYVRKFTRRFLKATHSSCKKKIFNLNTKPEKILTLKTLMGIFSTGKLYRLLPNI